MANTTYLTLGEAAKACGKSKATISKALKEGKISFVEKTKAGYKIDPAALFSVYPAVSKNVQNEHIETPINTNENSALQREVELLREMLDETRADRDSWKQQAQKITALIEDKSDKPVGFWSRLIGKK